MQQLKDNVKDNIVNNAKKLFSKNGYHDTTMRQIAVASAITVGNIYRYFANKDVLFNHTVKEAYEKLFLLMDDASKDKKLDILDPKYMQWILGEVILICLQYRKELIILIRRYLEEGKYPLFLKLEKLIGNKIITGAPKIDIKVLPIITHILIQGILYVLQKFPQKDLEQYLSFLISFLFKNTPERIT